MSEELHLIQSFDRNENECVQLFLKKYNHKYYVDLRIWFKQSEGDLKPTKKGITFTGEQFDDLKKGMDEISRLREGMREKQASKQTFTGRREAVKMTAKTNPNSF